MEKLQAEVESNVTRRKESLELLEEWVCVCVCGGGGWGGHEKGKKKKKYIKWSHGFLLDPPAGPNPATPPATSPPRHTAPPATPPSTPKEGPGPSRGM